MILVQHINAWVMKKQRKYFMHDVSRSQIPVSPVTVVFSQKFDLTLNTVG